jgi:hypothetical protein
MDERKFKPGDRVAMTEETRSCNERARSFTGTVVNYSTLYPEQVRLRRDGLLTVEIWHEDAWELERAASAVFDNAGAGC